MPARTTNGVALLAAAACCGVLASGAQAANVTHIKPGFSPDRSGAQTAVTLTADFAGERGEVPSPVTGAVVHLPAGLAIHLRGAGICAKARLVARGPQACPSNSLVGRGSALLKGQIGVLAIPESATLLAFRGQNQGGHPTLEISGQGLSPLDVRVTFSGVLLGDQAPYGQKLVLTIPAIPTIPEEPNASTIKFSLTIGSPSRSNGTVDVPRTCPAGGFPFGAEFTFADGSTNNTKATAPCP
jgi:hypothetical protein